MKKFLAGVVALMTFTPAAWGGLVNCADFTGVRSAAEASAVLARQIDFCRQNFTGSTRALCMRQARACAERVSVTRTETETVKHTRRALLSANGRDGISGAVIPPAESASAPDRIPAATAVGTEDGVSAVWMGADASRSEYELRPGKDAGFVMALTSAVCRLKRKGVRNALIDEACGRRGVCFSPWAVRWKESAGSCGAKYEELGKLLCENKIDGERWCSSLVKQGAEGVDKIEECVAGAVRACWEAVSGSTARFVALCDTGILTADEVAKECRAVKGTYHGKVSDGDKMVVAQMLRNAGYVKAADKIMPVKTTARTPVKTQQNTRKDTVKTQTETKENRVAVKTGTSTGTNQTQHQTQPNQTKSNQTKPYVGDVKFNGRTLASYGFYYGDASSFRWFLQRLMHASSVLMQKTSYGWLYHVFVRSGAYYRRIDVLWQDANHDGKPEAVKVL